MGGGLNSEGNEGAEERMRVVAKKSVWDPTIL